MYRIAHIFLIISFYNLHSPYCKAQSAKDIVTKAEHNIHGLTSVTEMTIQVVRPSWTRTMSVKAWSKGEQYSLMVITAPAKDAGTVFLKRIREIWNWLPSIERVVKLPPSMMAQSWMGTDFTNDDLVKASSRIDDYTHKIAGDSMVAGRKCWKIEMIPLPEAAVVWSKVNIWIDQKDYLELRIEFYDEDNKLVNILQCSDIKNMGGRVIPAKMEMIPAEKKGQETVIIYNNATFDKPIADNVFTTENMKKVK
jgi:outer membrane lipoprotein-sorting protein